jgi:alpha-amylase
MDDLRKTVKKQNELYGPEVVHLLGNFVANHDQMRPNSKNPDMALRRNMLIYMMTGVGMPMLYYGVEQDMADADRAKWGDDAATRPLWDVGYNTSHPMYRFIARLGNVRRSIPQQHFTHA